VVKKLVAAGIDTAALHLGATDSARVHMAAERNGVIADVAPDDPLRNLLLLADEGATRRAVDRAGVVGASIGAVVGAAFGLTPAGHVVIASPSFVVLANAGLFLVIGAIVGSVLGAALGPQPSTHAGFRLIDGMQAGAYALVASVPRERHDELQRLLEATGASGITRV
jgi:hypothetical protein